MKKYMKSLKSGPTIPVIRQRYKGFTQDWTYLEKMLHTRGGMISLSGTVEHSVPMVYDSLVSCNPAALFTLSMENV